MLNLLCEWGMIRRIYHLYSRMQHTLCYIHRKKKQMGIEYHHWLTSRIKNGGLMVDFVEEVDLKQTAKQLLELLEENKYWLLDMTDEKNPEYAAVVTVEELAEVLKELTHIRPKEQE